LNDGLGNIQLLFLLSSLLFNGAGFGVVIRLNAGFSGFVLVFADGTSLVLLFYLS
jgi:hypothetical protein